MKLHLGCAGKIKEGWINVDIRPNKGVDVVMDLRKLSFDDSVADYIYSRHVLEHFSRSEVRGVLIEWVRVLKPGGMIEVDFPDLEKYVSYYMEHKTKIPIEEFSRWVYGNQDHEYNYHKAGLSASMVSRILEELNITVCSINDAPVGTKLGKLLIGSVIKGKKE